MTTAATESISRTGRSAIHYATHFGWFVFPCHWPTVTGANGEARCSCGKIGCKDIGKHPKTQHGLKDATTDVLAIARWYKRAPDSNVAIVCGSGSGIVAIDVDDGPDKFGSESLEALEERLGKLPSTVEGLTGGGGRHLLFRCPRGVPISSRVGIAPGVDVRGDGGYIIAPPSLHRTGNLYQWEASSRPDEHEPADLPPEWLAALRNAPVDATPTQPIDFDNLPPNRTRRARAYAARMPPAIAGSGGHDQTFKVALALVRGMCLTSDEAMPILREYNTRCSPPWSEKELRHKVSDATANGKLPWGYLLGPKAEPAKETESKPDTEPRRIVIRTDEPRVIDEAVAALTSSGAPFYQRGGMLVRVVRGDTGPRSMTRIADTPTIAQLPLPRLQELMAGSATWVKEKETKDGEIIDTPAHPPPWAVAQVQARGEWQGVRSLYAIVETPVLRPDGSILSTPGYDDATGIIYEPNCKDIPIPDSPTQAHAFAALRSLLDVVSDFPFAADIHQSAWVAALLTPFAKFAFHGPAPISLVDATTRGSGKTLLVDAISHIVTGREMARMPQAEDSEEERKRITSIALSAFRCVLLDNVTRIGSTALDAALTATSWTERILGESRSVVLPLNSVWYATGNNVQLKGDIVRRTLHIRLESGDENPEARTGFAHPSLVEWIQKERARLIGACLTILRAYCLTNQDETITPWGSFEAWSRVVRGAVVFAGLPDPGLTRSVLSESSDTDVAALAELHAGWAEMGVDLGNTRNAMTPGTVAHALVSNPGKYGRLRDALAEFCRIAKGGSPSASDIGYVCRRFRGRVVAGKRLVMTGIVRGQRMWEVEAVSA